MKHGAAAGPQCTVADALMLTRKTGGCRGWAESYPQKTLKSYSPAPVSMALFGNRIFADVVKLTMRSSGWTLGHCDWSLRRAEMQKQIHAERWREPLGGCVLTEAETGVMLLRARNAKDCQPPQKPAESREQISREPAEGAAWTRRRSRAGGRCTQAGPAGGTAKDSLRCPC